ncbi:MAG TPA: hypothetical protein VKQ36_03445, partial [Ktedonobacterales bacterium]|nr:hypothetical protein [Ktedonobacterales bacterium]
RVRSLPDAVARSLELHLEAQASRPDNGENGDEDAENVIGEATIAASTSVTTIASHVNGNGSAPTGAASGKLAQYSVTGNLCTQCGNNTMYNEEGCRKCVSCGYSEC